MGYRLFTLLVFASCTFAGTSADGVEDGDDVVGDGDGGPLPGQAEIVDTDFTMGTHVSTSNAEPGVLEPNAYAVDGLRVRSYQNGAMGGNAHAIQGGRTFAMLETMLAGDQKGTAYYRPPTSEGDRNVSPANLGVTPDNFVLLFDGELRVTPGMHHISIDCDDVSVLELGSPDAPLGTIFNELNEPPEGFEFEPPAGVEWIPIRVALEDDEQGYHADINLDGTAITKANLRVRVNDHRGLHVRAGSDYYMVRGESVVSDLDDDFGYDEPPLFPGVGTDRFGMRYVGQIFIEAEGEYEFRARVQDMVHDNARVRIDGNSVARTWFGAYDPPVPTTLTAGWHDLVVDLADRINDAALHVGVRRVGEVDFQPIPPETLRPIAAVGLSTLTFDGAFNLPVPTSGAPLSVQLDPMLPPEVVIEWQDLLFSIDPMTTNAVTVTADDCELHAIPLHDIVGQFHEGGETCRGQHPVPVALSFSATGGNFTASKVGVASSYHGGTVRPPYIAEAIFESRILDTQAATALISLGVSGDARDGKIRALVRSGTDVTTAAWVEVGSDGVVPPGTAVGDQTQYRIVMETGGWSRTTVDSVKLTYARP